MNIIIREATKEDAALIAALSRETFYETFAGDNAGEDMELFMSRQFTTENLVAEVGAPGNVFLLAYCYGEPVGYAKLREHTTSALGSVPAWEIARLYAVSAWIGKGVGKALMEASIKLAKANHKEMIWLGVWKRNHKAIGFYERFGFEKFGETQFILGNDIQCDWLMKKGL